MDENKAIFIKAYVYFNNGTLNLIWRLYTSKKYMILLTVWGWRSRTPVARESRLTSLRLSSGQCVACVWRSSLASRSMSSRLPSQPTFSTTESLNISSSISNTSSSRKTYVSTSVELGVTTQLIRSRRKFSSSVIMNDVTNLRQHAHDACLALYSVATRVAPLTADSPPEPTCTAPEAVACERPKTTCTSRPQETVGKGGGERTTRSCCKEHRLRQSVRLLSEVVGFLLKHFLAFAWSPPNRPITS